jgi:hypothetical protein
MTKKHFIALGDATKTLINSTLKDNDGNEVARCFNEWQQKMIVDTFARALSGQNITFNKARWIGYVKGENGPNGGATS